MNYQWTKKDHARFRTATAGMCFFGLDEAEIKEKAKEYTSGIEKKWDPAGAAIEAVDMFINQECRYSDDGTIERRTE